jgi:hypothetical protein
LCLESGGRKVESSFNDSFCKFIKTDKTVGWNLEEKRRIKITQERERINKEVQKPRDMPI